MLKSAFNFILNLKSRTATITRPGVTPVTAAIKFAPSNYSRKLEGPSETSIKGREYVVSKDYLVGQGFPTPLKRGDRITDTELGNLTITEINEMYDIGGVVIGYRIRTG